MPTPTLKIRCKDCRREDVTTVRPAPHPGPRCTTHWRVEKARRKVANHGRRIQAAFGLTARDYAVLKASQGGRCFICRYATGKAKALAVDHEHHRPGCEHPPERGCYLCVRALLCGPCNQTIGRLGPDALRRAIQVFTDPPARKVLLGR